MGSPTKAASSKSFGVLLGVTLLVIAAWKYTHGAPSYSIFASSGALLLVMAVFMPRLLRPIKTVWLRLGNLLGRMFSPIALTLIYLVAIIPVGLLLKIFRKDTLRLAQDPGATSYWITREPPGPDPDSLKDQF
jgi:hypothetical protein